MLKNHFFQTIFWLFVVLGIHQVSAQDIHFSQFSQTPLSVNPAYTGMFEGNWRFTNNYRNQWSAVGTPFKTISAGFDKPIKLRKGEIGLGVYVLNDQSGAANLTANKIMLSFAYQYNLNGHTIVAGIQAGYTIHSYELDQLTFPGQYDSQSGMFDANMPNYLDAWDENIDYPDVNLGLAWTSNFNDIIPVVGFSAHHINSPELSFLREDAKLAPRFAFNANAYIPLQEMWYAKPNLYTNYQKNASNYLVGGTIGYKFPLEELLDKVYTGVQMRTQFHSTDALVAIIGVGVMGIDVGISYDLNVSALNKATNMRGAFELSIVYTNFISDLKRITIPCDRY
jgi:type IX secretion system PorP/SprF family membrane protein